jgi:uncharacterized surface protein with fasciclin (FAS1) repeats
LKKFLAAGAVALAALSLTTGTASAGAGDTIAQNVIDLASGDPAEFTVLLAAVQAADPAVLAAIDNCEDGPVTVFAPTDAAFAAKLAELGLTAEQVLSNTELLTSILLYHVVDGAVPSSALTDGQMVTTLNTAQVAISIEGDTVMVNDATVVTPDVPACNGVIHVIDAVLMPPAEDTGGEMPGTGSNLTMTIIALGLLAMGSVIVLGARRRATV